MTPDELAARLGLPAAMPHLEIALTHPSFANERRGSVADRAALALAHNQRLEFLGDAVLGLCVTEALVQEWPSATEGELSFARARLVSTEALATFADREGVGAAIRFGKGSAQAGDRERRKVLADAVEALVGAAYLDGGLALARELCARVVAEPLEALRKGGVSTRDPKSLLQEQIQSMGKAAPRYALVDEEGPKHARTFVIACESDGQTLAVGRGRSKKIAEQEAARAALAALEEGPSASVETTAEDRANDERATVDEAAMNVER